MQCTQITTKNTLKDSVWLTQTTSEIIGINLLWAENFPKKAMADKISLSLSLFHRVKIFTLACNNNELALAAEIWNFLE